MHFAIYAILPNKKLEDFNQKEFEDDFTKKFCDCCGENEPTVECISDWYEIGGRWCDNLKASRGIKGNLDWMRALQGQSSDDDGQYSVCEVQDLTATPAEPYAFVMNDEYAEEGTDKYNQIMNRIRSRSLNGLIVLLDCHN